MTAEKEMKTIKKKKRKRNGLNQWRVNEGN